MYGENVIDRCCNDCRFRLGEVFTSGIYDSPLGLAEGEAGFSNVIIPVDCGTTLHDRSKTVLLGTIYGEDLSTSDGRGIAKDSPRRAECSDNDDYFVRKKDTYISVRIPLQGLVSSPLPCLGSTNDAKFSRRRVSYRTFIAGSQYMGLDLINKLPDELLQEIFSWLPRARDRAVCASVSMRWLMLQSHMHRREFKVRGQLQTSEAVQEVSSESCGEAFGRDTEENLTDTDIIRMAGEGRVERQPQWAIGDLSRGLEGRKANDVRLAAIAVGTGARGGLGKLSIRGGSVYGHEKGVTNLGLSAIGLCCSALRSLSLWDCPHVGNEGLVTIGKGCRLLEKVDIFKCPAVGDEGLQGIAKNCPFLSHLTLEYCGLVGNAALSTAGEYCLGLKSLQICECPLIGDEGILTVLVNSKKLKKLKLQGIAVGDRSLAAIGQYCKVLLFLSLEGLELITEEGFTLLGQASGMHSLKYLSIISCLGLTDCALGSLGMCCKELKHLSLGKCENVSDQGLTCFLQAAISLEILQLERCNSLSFKGLLATFTTSHGKLRKLQIRKCDGIDDRISAAASLQFCESVKVLCISNCKHVSYNCLAIIGHICQHLTELDLSGLVDMNDEGLLALLQMGNCQLESINLSGCVRVTDQAISVVAKWCGSSLRNLTLDGCKMLTDKSLKVIAKNCSHLQDLDASQCNVSDKGVAALLLKRGGGLSSINLSGCSSITDKILPFFEKKCTSLVGLNLKNCQGLSRKLLDRFESRLQSGVVFSS
eukprot:c26170_g2_i1 orf=338-2623(+)